MSDSRIAYLTSMLEPYKEILTNLAHVDPQIRNQYYHGRYNHQKKEFKDVECTDRMLGALIRSLTAFDLWPLPEACDVTISPSLLRQTLATLDISPRKHESCGPCVYCPGTVYDENGAVHSERILPSCEHDFVYDALPREIAFLTKQAARTGLSA